MIKNSKDYKEYLKQNILDTLDELDPYKHTRDNTQMTECPICGNDYLYFPDFSYGRCQECGHEEGFEKFSAVITSRKKIYDEICEKIKKAIE